MTRALRRIAYEPAPVPALATNRPRLTIVRAVHEARPEPQAGPQDQVGGLWTPSMREAGESTVAWSRWAVG